jgi:hypothetical protein
LTNSLCNVRKSASQRRFWNTAQLRARDDLPRFLESRRQRLVDDDMLAGIEHSQRL